MSGQAPRYTVAPIIFSASMVRALLAGHKTQTRRLLRFLNPADLGKRLRDPRVFIPHDGEGAYLLPAMQGDRLLVREGLYCPNGDDWWYRADDAPVELDRHDPRVPAMVAWAHHKMSDYASPIHMPRWASRLTLIVEGVKVEPLQAITWDDARAEGLDALSKDGKLVKYGLADRDGLPGGEDGGWHWQDWKVDPTAAFHRLWSTLHTKPGERWEDNPQVVALTFRVVRENIDATGALLKGQPS